MTSQSQARGTGGVQRGPVVEALGACSLAAGLGEAVCERPKLSWNEGVQPAGRRCIVARLVGEICGYKKKKALVPVHTCIRNLIAYRGS